MKTSLDRAVDDELARRTKIVSAIESLFHHFQSSYRSNNRNSTLDTKQVITALDFYQQRIKEIEDYMQNKWLLNQACFSARNNNLHELFDQAKLFAEEYFDLLIQKNSIHDIFKMNASQPTLFYNKQNGDIKGSVSQLSLIVVLMTAIAELTQIDSFANLDIFRDAKILDPHTSPIVQTTALPKSFNPYEVSSSLRGFPFLLEKPSAKFHLIIPTIGYAYGGSRCDIREYGAKTFKNHDCSSAIVEWTGSTEDFATSHMEQYYTLSCNQAKNDVKHTESADLLPSLYNLFTPLCEWNIHTIYPGLIFVLKPNGGDINRHSGIITGGLYKDGCFQTLSYNRIAGNQEGLGYDILCPDPHKHNLFFFATKENNNNECPVEPLGHHNVTFEIEPS